MPYNDILYKIPIYGTGPSPYKIPSYGPAENHAGGLRIVHMTYICSNNDKNT